MKIISLNVNGIRASISKGFFDWVREEDPDILCLQEIKISEDKLPFDLILLDDYISFFNHADRKGYSGVAVYSKKEPAWVNKTLGMERFDKEGRLLELGFDNFSLLNVYIPHGARDKTNLGYKMEVYESLRKRLENKEGGKVILVGDFNIAHKMVDLARPKENKNNIMFTFAERMQIEKLLGLGFVDSFREFKRGEGHYSWWPYSYDAYKKNIGWRIDYCFVSDNLASKLKGAFILKGVRVSDHCPVGVEIE